MSDTMSKAARSMLMSKIKSKDTRPERLLRAAMLVEMKETPGWYLEPDAKHLYGKPDLLLMQTSVEGLEAVAVFVHGCFWHCCPEHFRPPATRSEAWARKFAANVARDRRVRRALRAQGYRTMVVWEHDLKTRGAADRVAEKIGRRMKRICVDASRRRG